MGVQNILFRIQQDTGYKNLRIYKGHKKTENSLDKWFIVSPYKNNTTQKWENTFVAEVAENGIVTLLKVNRLPAAVVNTEVLPEERPRTEQPAASTEGAATQEEANPMDDATQEQKK